MPWRCIGEWRNSFINLDFGTWWGWVVSFTPLPLYPQFSLDMRLGGPQSRSGHFGEEKHLAPTGNRTSAVHIFQCTLYNEPFVVRFFTISQAYRDGYPVSYGGKLQLINCASWARRDQNKKTCIFWDMTPCRPKTLCPRTIPLFLTYTCGLK
jgi:hypothetical protein